MTQSPARRPSRHAQNHDVPLDHPLSPLKQAISHAAHLLPAQGPITVFIHHNTLHAFEHLPFHEAVTKGARVFGCHPYLGEDRYREELGRGRIRFQELRDVLEDDLGDQGGESVAALCTRLELRLAMLQYPLRTAPAGELLWFVAETDALRRVRTDTSEAVRKRLVAETRRWVLRDLRGDPNTGHAGAGVETWDDREWEAFALRTLWRVCCDGLEGVPAATDHRLPPVRHRDVLLEAAGIDTDQWVNDLLTRFCAAFLDQGVAQWPLPDRERGFFQAFCSLYRQGGGPPDLWMRGLADDLGRRQDEGIGSLETICEVLGTLGVTFDEWDEYLAATVLALRGWGGMVRQVEERGDRAAQPIPEGSLIEFLAVRLLLEKCALTEAAREAFDFTGPLRYLRQELKARTRTGPPGVEQRAFVVFQLAQVLGWAPNELHRLTPADWADLVGEIETFSATERQRVFHLAYEHRFRTQSLDALALHKMPVKPRPEGERSAARRGFTAIFCIDEREESFRRHLEEVAPDVETFGAAGFFSVAMYYRGAADAHFVPLCPVVIKPRHWVEEQVVGSQEEEHRRRAKTRRALGTASHRVHLGTRSFAVGALLTAGLGVLASVPLVARILCPRLTSKVRSWFSRLVRVPRKTRLKLERSAAEPGCDNGGLGFNLDEMTAVAERLLGDIGMTSDFSRLVLVIGHGSTSLNNPHKSAYDCGACGGSAGEPNARALAVILNDPRVRLGLADRGLVIPDETLFVGGVHNTCNDAVTFADLDHVPASHREEFEAARRAVEEACDRNAHERCRRFLSAPLTMSFPAARQHVEARSEDLGQTRPECGHATNALTIIGRRERTRGLFLDRRSFLVSYDPTSDDAEAAVLTRVLQAVTPVCAGISLEYYFSYVDPAGWGCGTKLPHNVTSLLGVMDGAASDLRTGLPVQMTEIHEPVRSLFVIESTPDVLARIMDRDEAIGRLVRNEWIQLAALDPHSSKVHVFRDGEFREYETEATRLPSTPSSADWYRGWRDHLEFAEIIPDGQEGHSR